MNYFIYTSHHFTPHGRYELNKLTSLQMCDFIAQLVEHGTGNAEVTGSNPVEEGLKFQRWLSIFTCTTMTYLINSNNISYLCLKGSYSFTRSIVAKADVNSFP